MIHFDLAVSCWVFLKLKYITKNEISVKYPNQKLCSEKYAQNAQNIYMS